MIEFETMDEFFEYFKDMEIHPGLLPGTIEDDAESELEEEITEETPQKGLKAEVEVILDDTSLAEPKNKIVVHTTESLQACTDEVAVAPGHERVPLVPNTGTHEVAVNVQSRTGNISRTYETEVSQ